MTGSGNDALIVDADCHISSSRFDGLALTASDLIGHMDQAGVDKALIWLKPPYDKNIDPENRAIHDAVKAHPGRFLGFGWANPRLGLDHAKDMVKRCYEEYGLLGIKFNGAQDDYVIDDEEVAMPAIEYAARFGKPLAFHIGGDFPENTHPYRLGRIARRFPEVKFILIHIGGASFPPLDRSSIETAKANPNISVIGSAVHERAIMAAIDVLGAERVCFGSDMPFFLMHARLAMYRALLEGRPQAEINAILGDNIRRIAGDLPADEASAGASAGAR
ncbi:amidohydrolase family protein [Pelagibacterium montanilacus]|uniref:amidohydrolase family protein n=1 Tax=Pelagibacterium montanilacus TaxID=2185280 RepID=UPI0013DE9110|nr:amidohydrolase family protein [Pelagibacterium montanilacus]